MMASIAGGVDAVLAEQMRRRAEQAPARRFCHRRAAGARLDCFFEADLAHARTLSRSRARQSSGRISYALKNNRGALQQLHRACAGDGADQFRGQRIAKRLESFGFWILAVDLARFMQETDRSVSST